jgi:hypothetical protein
MLIFVFEGVSSGRMRLILAEFAPVPNAPSDVDSTSRAAEIKAAGPLPDARKTPDIAQRTEVGGPAGPEPTRFGDWEKNGRCIDF